MPAVSVTDILSVPVVEPPLPGTPVREAAMVVPAVQAVEGAGFRVWRPFPGQVHPRATDPFFLLDEIGPTDYGPGEAVGAPWHPHRGFETVTYIIDGELAHHDSTGGGGVIGAGDTQWMTAGAGILHDEVPTDRFVRSGGRFHGIQLWVNLPARLKMVPPRYQPISGSELALGRSPDGGALIRVIAGDVGSLRGPGVTRTPITYLHVTVHPGAEVRLGWPAEFSCLIYVLEGRSEVGDRRRPVDAHQLAVTGPGEAVVLRAPAAGRSETANLEALVLGGLPIREPIAHWGPFLMNTREELVRAIEDYRAGRLGTIPATTTIPVEGGTRPGT